MSSYHVLAIVAVVAIIIFFINRHYQKKGIPLDCVYEEESISHRTASANAGVDDPYFKDSSY